MNTAILLTIGILVLCVLGCTCYTIITNTKKNDAMLQMQIQASKARGNDHVRTLPYSQLKDILNDIIGFYITETILLLGLDQKGNEELSVIMDDILTQICTDVRNGMSESLMDGFRSYVSDKYVMDLIKDTSRIVLIAKLGK